VEAHNVIPAPYQVRDKLQPESFEAFLDPGFRRGDGLGNPTGIKLLTLNSIFAF
jgi:hypothetical protein